MEYIIFVVNCNKYVYIVSNLILLGKSHAFISEIWDLPISEGVQAPAQIL